MDVHAFMHAISIFHYIILDFAFYPSPETFSTFEKISIPVEEDLLQNQQITIKLYTIYKRQRHRHEKEQYYKEKERKERKWQPLITSECSSYFPRSSSSTYIRA